MTKSKVMPTAILRGAPLSRPALTYIFPINNPACPECYTIGLKVGCLTLSHVRPLFSMGESDQMPSCFPVFAYLYWFFSRYLQGFAYLLQRHCLLLQRRDHKKGYVTPTWNRCSLFSRQVLHTLCQFISFKFRRQCLIWKISSLKKYVMPSSNAVFAFSQQRCCIPFLVQILELRRHYLAAKNALHFLKNKAKRSAK